LLFPGSDSGLWATLTATAAGVVVLLAAKPAHSEQSIPNEGFTATSGGITAPVVYAGSGSSSDFDWLASRGIDVRGTIALVRNSIPYRYRGYNVFAAQVYAPAFGCEPEILPGLSEAVDRATPRRPRRRRRRSPEVSCLQLFTTIPQVAAS